MILPLIVVHCGALPFLISIASLTQRLYLSVSVPMTSSSPQSMIWILSTTWSVMADICVVERDSFRPALVITFLHTFSTSVVCSSNGYQIFSPFLQCMRVHNSYRALIYGIGDVLLVSFIFRMHKFFAEGVLRFHSCYNIVELVNSATRSDTPWT